ncbi:hypothetical protein [Devosia sp. A16]|uniref:hypothetical protein n=1 Tax=Devosia sp. A16 TaxID=1736675 RepID=UPI0006D7DA0E|nr:hypothetical protein [Devosia sp. A16]
MSATVLAALLAGGLGLVAGGYCSTVGWIVVGNLLLATTATASLVANADLLTALGWTALAIVAFNIGLMLGLIIRRPVVVPRPA